MSSAKNIGIAQPRNVSPKVREAENSKGYVENHNSTAQPYFYKMMSIRKRISAKEPFQKKQYHLLQNQTGSMGRLNKIKALAMSF